MTMTSPAIATPAHAVPAQLVLDVLDATRAAAIAAARLAGAGDPIAADRAATDALRAALATIDGIGTVVTGEGAKDAAPMLADGERIGGATTGFEFDVAVDPLECTDLCARGLPGALVTLALAPRGSLWEPGPAFYMDKLVLPPAARGVARLTDPPEITLVNVARALGKRLDQLRVTVLDKPRNAELAARLRAVGASVVMPPAGDVAGALSVLLPGGASDLLLGIGGTPEGVLAACAARALGGDMQGRPAPQRPDERRALARLGISTDAVLGLSDLVAAGATFIATGVTGGLLNGPRTIGRFTQTDSIVISDGAIQHIHHSRRDDAARNHAPTA